MLSAGLGRGRGGCDERASLLSIIRGEAGIRCSHMGLSRGEEHGAKATLKALSVPPQHERVGMESKETG